MHPYFRLARLAGIALLSTAALVAHAQGASPAKKELVQKVLTLQQVGIESIGNGLAMQTANQVLQVAGQALARVPEDKRQAVGADMQAEVKKFYEDIAQLLRASASKNAPSTIGTALEEKFSEDELKTLIGWLESPVSKKFQQVSGELQQALGQKIVTETRGQIEPKLKTLEGTLQAKLRAAAGEQAGQGASKPPAAPKK